MQLWWGWHISLTRFVFYSPPTAANYYPGPYQRNHYTGVTLVLWWFRAMATELFVQCLVYANKTKHKSSVLIAIRVGNPLVPLDYPYKGPEMWTCSMLLNNNERSRYRTFHKICTGKAFVVFCICIYIYQFRWLVWIHWRMFCGGAGSWNIYCQWRQGLATAYTLEVMAGNIMPGGSRLMITWQLRNQGHGRHCIGIALPEYCSLGSRSNRIKFPKHKGLAPNNNSSASAINKESR